nr:unnamed protein product [Digitaria exilis]
MERSPNPNPIAIAKPGRREQRDRIGAGYASPDSIHGELPAAASKPPSSPPAEAELSLGVARSCGDPGGGGGWGGCWRSCCWPAAKTTLLSNVDHFMVPTPHPARRSRPDPADSPEFRRDSSPPLVSPNKILFTLFLASASRSSPPTSYFCSRLLVFSLPSSFPLFFSFVSSFSPTRLHNLSLSSLLPRRPRRRLSLLPAPLLRLFGLADL